MCARASVYARASVCAHANELARTSVCARASVYARASRSIVILTTLCTSFV